MERLTTRTVAGTPNLNYPKNCYFKDGRKDNVAISAFRQLAIERLADYEDVEEQGLLVRLPCKRGDKVWRICGPKKRKFVAERTVLSVTMYNPGEFEVFTNCFDWLGKTVFLTREESEKALEEANRNG